MWKYALKFIGNFFSSHNKDVESFWKEPFRHQTDKKGVFPTRKMDFSVEKWRECNLWNVQKMPRNPL